MPRADKIIDSIYEMATIGPRIHKFGVKVKLNILQPGPRKLQHGPRIKVISLTDSTNFSISILENPKVVAGKSFLSGKDLKTLIISIKINKDNFLKFWNSPNMSVDELEDILI